MNFVEEKNILVMSCHPGTVRTDITKPVLESWGYFLAFYAMYPLYWFISKDASSGAQTQVMLAADPSLSIEHDGGQYFADCAQAPVKSPLDKNVGIAEELWRVSVHLSGIEK